MSKSQSLFRKLMSKERSLSQFIPYSSHVADDIIITKDGDLMCMWRMDGMAFETVDAEDLEIRKEQLNTAFRTMANNNTAIWMHNVRSKTSDRLDCDRQGYASDYNEAYFDSFGGYNMMRNDLYISLIYRPLGSGLQGKFNKNLNSLSYEDAQEQRVRNIKHMREIAGSLEMSLARYGIERLTCYEEDDVVYSDMLTFLNFLVSGEMQRVRLSHASICDILGSSWIRCGEETIEIRSPTKQRYVQYIDIKDYVGTTYSGILNKLMYEPYEYIITQSFGFMSQSKAKSYLKRLYGLYQSSEDGSDTLIGQLKIAEDDLQSGQFAMGEYHFTMGIYSDSVHEVEFNRQSASAKLKDLGFVPALQTLANDASFFSQLPAAFKYRPRIANLTTQNLAGMASLHNFSMGKRDQNPWGQAVTLFKSASGQPYYFNYHYTSPGDSYGSKPLGNLSIIGESGSGKTVLMTHLLLQSQKYRDDTHKLRCVFFDKDRGAELLIRRMGGNYLAIQNGKPTGCNPLQIEPTEDNLLFLEKLVSKLAQRDNIETTVSDEKRISHAVRAVMRLPKAARRLSVLLQNMTEGTSREDKENSLVQRLSKWCYSDLEGKQGVYWWVLDCPQDEIDFSSHDVTGVDGTHFLDNEDIRTPLSMYLLHRLEDVIDGNRLIYMMDETWKWVGDEAFSEFAGNKQLTIRKQNGLGVFATQMPSSLLKSRIANELVQQCATQIFLPNPKGIRKEYVEGFGLTDREFEVVKSLGSDSRMFLVKQGQNGSALVQLNLAGFDDYLAIMSGSTDNVALLDAIRSEVGDDPNIWEPIFHER